MPNRPHLEVAATALQAALTRLSWLVPKRTTAAPFEYARAEGLADGIVWTYANNDYTLTFKTEGSGVGTVYLPVHAALASARKFSTAVTIEATDKDKVAIKAKTTGFAVTLSGLTVDWTEPAKPGQPFAGFQIVGDQLGWALELTNPCIGREETRPYLQGVNLSTDTYGKHRGLRAAATDGHKLARCELGGEAKALSKTVDMRKLNATVPKLGVLMLMRLLLVSGETDMLSAVQRDGGWMTFTCSNWTLGCKLLDGTAYPDTLRIMPAADALVTTVKVDSNALDTALDRLSALSCEDRPLSLTTVGKDTLKVFVKLDGADGTETLAASVEGPALKIGASNKSLQEAANMVEGHLVLKAGKDGPLQITDSAEPGFTFLLMPWARVEHPNSEAKTAPQKPAKATPAPAPSKSGKPAPAPSSKPRKASKAKASPAPAKSPSKAQPAQAAA